MKPEPLLFTARAIADPNAVVQDGAILIERLHGAARTLASGRSDEVRRHPLARAARRIDRPDSLLIPGLVNAHAHLDLTHIGPRPDARGKPFLEFITIVRSGRCGDDAAADSVARGAALSDAGGTVAIGDIAGSGPDGPSLAPALALRDWNAVGGIRGVSFIEFFGLARLGAIDRVQGLLGSAGLRAPSGLGISPHAPYTVGPAGFARARGLAGRHRIPLCTHLAETIEERRLIAHADGPFRGLLGAIGAWGPECEPSSPDGFGQGLSPVEHWARRLGGGPMLLAHVNDASGSDIRRIAGSGAAVVYCPRASAFFGAQESFGPHRYRDMLDAGINVCLGTDSIINLPMEAARPDHGISVLDEMRVLRARDGADPRLLLEMGTTRGARALGMDPAAFVFTPDAPLAGIVEIPLADSGVDPWRSALDSLARPRLLLRWGVLAPSVGDAATQEPG